MSPTASYAHTDTEVAHPDIGRHLTGKLLVATHGGSGGRAALRIAEALAARDGLPIEALTVVEPTRARPFDYIPDLHVFEAAEMDAARTQIKALMIADTPRDERLPDLSVLLGNPADCIAQAATETHARLILLGLGHRRLVDRLLGGAIPIQVLRQVQIPMLAAAVESAPFPGVVVVATDFSTSAIAAARLAMCLAAPNARVFLVHVQPELAASHAGTPVESWLRIVQQGTTTMFEHMHRALGPTDELTIEDVTLHDGHAGVARTLRRFARDVGAEMIAIGTHGPLTTRRSLLGSVAEAMLRTANCAVLVSSEDR